MTEQHKSRRNKRSFWWIFIMVMFLLAMLSFLLTRCDFVNFKWKEKPTPIAPIARTTPLPTPFTQPHNDTDQANIQEPIIEDGVIVDDGTIDNRGSDPETLDNDPELKKGDEGVEGSTGIQALSAMTKLYPNKNITGKYPVNDVIAFGSKYFGRKYQYGSDRNTDSSFDCSDFTQWIWNKGAGMPIPKDSRSQWEYVIKYGSRYYYDLNKAQRGDLLFFMTYRGTKPADYAGINKSVATITHVGIYLGDGRMMHTASAATGGVRIDNVFGRHYQYRFLRGGSVL